MYINFQLNWVSRSVQTVYTTLFAKKNHELLKLVTTNSNLKTLDLFVWCFYIYSSKSSCVGIELFVIDSLVFVQQSHA